MLVYFARHGLARSPNWNGFDHDRPLTPQGHEQLRDFAQPLAQRLPAPSLILHSPYRRAAQTAAIWADVFNQWESLREHPRLAPGFDMRAMRDVLAEHADHTHVMMVGHAPDMADLVFDLTHHHLHFAEGTVAAVQMRPEPPTLLWTHTPG